MDEVSKLFLTDTWVLSSLMESTVNINNVVFLSLGSLSFSDVDILSSVVPWQFLLLMIFSWQFLLWIWTDFFMAKGFTDNQFNIYIIYNDRLTKIVNTDDLYDVDSIWSQHLYCQLTLSVSSNFSTKKYLTMVNFISTKLKLILYWCKCLFLFIILPDLWVLELHGNCSMIHTLVFKFLFDSGQSLWYFIASHCMI